MKNIENKTIVTPGEFLAKKEYYKAREGTYGKNNNIYSSVVGIVNIRDDEISVTKLSGDYMPKKGDKVVGKVIDMNYSNWFIDINCPYDASLPIREASRQYLDTEKYDMTHFFDYNDLIYGKIIEITDSKKITLTLKEPECKKLVGGILTKIEPSKIPRLIGTKGNMINMIKEATNTEIVIGQNGLVWIKGNAVDVKKVKELIEIISNESHTHGLTIKIEKLLNKKGGKK